MKKHFKTDKNSDSFQSKCKYKLNYFFILVCNIIVTIQKQQIEFSHEMLRRTKSEGKLERIKKIDFRKSRQRCQRRKEGHDFFFVKSLILKVLTK